MIAMINTIILKKHNDKLILLVGVVMLGSWPLMLFHTYCSSPLPC